jgi:hypothetical protein
VDCRDDAPASSIINPRGGRFMSWQTPDAPPHIHSGEISACENFALPIAVLVQKYAIVIKLSQLQQDSYLNLISKKPCQIYNKLIAYKNNASNNT